MWVSLLSFCVFYIPVPHAKQPASTRLIVPHFLGGILSPKKCTFPVPEWRAMSGALTSGPVT